MQPTTGQLRFHLCKRLFRNLTHKGFTEHCLPVIGTSAKGGVKISSMSSELKGINAKVKVVTVITFEVVSCHQGSRFKLS